MDRFNIVLGIPRALLWYKYGESFWVPFFDRLGVKYVITKVTNREMLEKGLERAENEICFPVKVYFSHFIELFEKCDKIFVPRYSSVEEKAYTCPKLLALPDMVRLLSGHPGLLEPEIDVKSKPGSLWNAFRETGRYFTDDEDRIRDAFEYALKSQKLAEEAAYGKWKEGRLVGDHNNLRVLLVGHPYNIQDNYISLDILERLKKIGRKEGVEIQTIVPEDISKEILIKAASQGLSKDLFWSYERELVGAAFYLVEQGEMDGVIFVSGFPCGTNSTIHPFVDGRIEEAEKAFLDIVLDEHSGEAGTVTRIEAFVDVLLAKRRVKNAGKLDSL